VLEEIDPEQLPVATNTALVDKSDEIEADRLQLVVPVKEPVPDKLEAILQFSNPETEAIELHVPDALAVPYSVADNVDDDDNEETILQFKTPETVHAEIRVTLACSAPSIVADTVAVEDIVLAILQFK